MSPELTTLYHWAMVALWVACITATAFPILYLFTRWYNSRLGWAAMLRGIAFALALDLTLYFQVRPPTNLKLALLINAVVFTFIALVSVLWTFTMCVYNYNKYLRRKQRNTFMALTPDPADYSAKHSTLDLAGATSVEDPPWLVFSNGTYEALRAVVEVILPGSATLYLALATIWGLPGGEKVAGTIAAVTVFLGLIVRLARRSFNKAVVPDVSAPDEGQPL